MENTSYSDLLSASNPNTTFIQSLANNYGLATNYYGVTHTSLPNYVAVTSGSTWGSNSDDEAQADFGYFNHLSLFDQFNQAVSAGRDTWIDAVGRLHRQLRRLLRPSLDPNCTGTRHRHGSVRSQAQPLHASIRTFSTTRSSPPTLSRSPS